MCSILDVASDSPVALATAPDDRDAAQDAPEMCRRFIGDLSGSTPLRIDGRRR
jgi:hypothetical protein